MNYQTLTILIMKEKILLNALKKVELRKITAYADSKSES